MSAWREDGSCRHLGFDENAGQGIGQHLGNLYRTLGTDQRPRFSHITAGYMHGLQIRAPPTGLAGMTAGLVEQNVEPAPDEALVKGPRARVNRILQPRQTFRHYRFVHVVGSISGRGAGAGRILE